MAGLTRVSFLCEYHEGLASVQVDFCEFALPFIHVTNFKLVLMTVSRPGVPRNKSQIILFKVNKLLCFCHFGLNPKVNHRISVVTDQQKQKLTFVYWCPSACQYNELIDEGYCVSIHVSYLCGPPGSGGMLLTLSTLRYFYFGVFLFYAITLYFYSTASQSQIL